MRDFVKGLLSVIIIVGAAYAALWASDEMATPESHHQLLFHGVGARAFQFLTGLAVLRLLDVCLFSFIKLKDVIFGVGRWQKVDTTSRGRIAVAWILWYAVAMLAWMWGGSG